eukprot:scaffold29917_cov36-Tisochrysis_lutea.AAC.6
MEYILFPLPSYPASYENYLFPQKPHVFVLSAHREEREPSAGQSRPRCCSRTPGSKGKVNSHE